MRQTRHPAEYFHVHKVDFLPLTLQLLYMKPYTCKSQTAFIMDFYIQQFI